MWGFCGGGTGNGNVRVAVAALQLVHLHEQEERERHADQCNDDDYDQRPRRPGLFWRWAIADATERRFATTSARFASTRDAITLRARLRHKTASYFLRLFFLI